MKPLLSFKKGSSRFIVLVHFADIVIKFPIISFCHLFKMLWLFGIKRYDKKVLGYFFKMGYRYDRTLRWCLCRGILSNRYESEYFRRNKNQFCWPTHSFLWIINIQRKSDCNSINKEWLENKIKGIVGDDIYRDVHTLCNPENFCIDSENKIKIRDYGSKGVIGVLMKHEHLLCELQADLK